MKTRNSTGLYSMLLIALFAALTAICAWISVPTPIPFTLQTFAVFLASGLLGTKKALASLGIYILIGIAGLPVFSGFRAGFGVVIGPTGGYLLGFFFAVLISGIIVSRFGESFAAMFIGHLLGLLALYSFGTAWFVLGYQSGRQMGLIGALSVCVFPFIVPDILKISLAIFVAKRVGRAV